jgi:hypothetical protein
MVGDCSTTIVTASVLIGVEVFIEYAVFCRYVFCFEEFKTTWWPREIRN